MARKKQTSPIEAGMDLVAMLPWWAGIGIALFSYVFLHAIAMQAPPATFKPTDASGMMTGAIIRGFASFGQFVVPVICIFGAIGSYLRRKDRQSLVTDVAQSHAADSLDNMSWREFELLVGEAFRLQGYKVIETGGAGADGGVDLILSKGNEKFFVQCKQWKAYKVSVMVVRELYGVMAAKGAAGGFVVTSGSFTGDAKEFAAGRNIRLVDGGLLFGMIKQARGARSSRVEPSQSAQEPVLRQSSTVACPACGAAMKKRTAKKGASAGSEFWGCSTYPSCRGTRPLS